MTYLSRLSPLTVLDLIERGEVTSKEALDLAACNQWLARIPLGYRLKILAMLSVMSCLRER